MGLASAFAKSLDNSQILRLLHQQIEKHNPPVACRDDIDNQVNDIAVYMEDKRYPALAARKRRVNMLTGLLALPVLIFGLLLFSQRIANWFSLNIDTSAMAGAMIDFCLNNLWVPLGYAVILFGTIFYFYYLQKQTENYARQLISAFVTRISQ